MQIEVALVEKSPFLGGQTANLNRLYPTGEQAADLVKQLTDAVSREPRIKVYTCAQVIRSEGYVGNFKVVVEQAPPKSPPDLARLDLFSEKKTGIGDYVPFAGVCPAEIPGSRTETELNTGVIILATGFQTYQPRPGEFGYGDFPQVMTLPEFIRQMTANPGGDALVINGRDIRRLALIHCVGSRQIPGIHAESSDGLLNEYCSRTCCSATLQTACEVRSRFPKTQVLEYYRDIRTYGRGQEDYYDRASEDNVLFFRYEADRPPVVHAGDGSGHPLKISVNDTLTFGEEIEAGVDLAVLAVGMEPRRIQELAEMMKLPVGADRFLQEVHPKLRPVELANNGILLAGTCQAPMDIGEACSAAQAAAVKTSALLGKGYVELDPFVAQVDLAKCTGSGECAASCPVTGAIFLVETSIDGETVKRAEVNPALCTGCGICVAVCPANAVDVNGWRLKQYEEMVDAIVAV